MRIEFRKNFRENFHGTADPSFSTKFAKSGRFRPAPGMSASGKRWGNRPSSLWIADDFGVLRFRLMVKRGPDFRPQASEGEAQHGPFCWTRRVGQGDKRLHRG